MARVKVTTQKVHKVLQDAGLVSSMYKPSRKINRQGYDISTIIKGLYIVNPGPYAVEKVAEILNAAGIETFERKGLLGVNKFQNA